MAHTFRETPCNRTNVRIIKWRRAGVNWILRGLWKLVPGVTGRLVDTLFFAPRKYRLKEQEKAILSRARSFTIRVHDKDLCCWQWGEGPAVLYVHGWNGSGIQFQSFIEPSFVPSKSDAEDQPTVSTTCAASSISCAKLLVPLSVIPIPATTSAVISTTGFVSEIR